MDFENWKIEKQRIIEEEAAALEEYAAAAEWCNNSGNYTIIEDNDYYKVIKLPEPEPEQPAPEVSDNEIIENLE